MSAQLSSLRETHDRLRSGIELLREAADRVGEILHLHDAGHGGQGLHLPPALSDPTHQSRGSDRLPRGRDCLGKRLAAQSMSKDHRDVVRLTEELDAMRSRLVAGTSINRYAVQTIT